MRSQFDAEDSARITVVCGRAGPKSQLVRCGWSGKQAAHDDLLARKALWVLDSALDPQPSRHLILDEYGDVAEEGGVEVLGHAAWVVAVNAARAVGSMEG